MVVSQTQLVLIQELGTPILVSLVLTASVVLAVLVFPKDISAFVNFTTYTPLLEYVMDRNNQYRSEYEKDDREIEQNIEYK